MPITILSSLKEMFLHPITWILQKFQIKIVNASDFQKDILEMQKATEQITQDWLGMIRFISQIKIDQNNFASQLETENKELEQAITQVLEEMSIKNEKKYAVMNEIVSRMKEEIHSMKTLFERPMLPSEELSEKTDEEEIDDNFAETDGENRIRKDGSMKKNGNNTEFDTTKFISTLKMCLTDLLKDAKLHLSGDREEENRELQIILMNLAEDRENLKKTIMQTFSIVAEQAKKNQEQFGQIGHDTLQYVSVLNDNSDKLLRLKLDETDDVLNSILVVMEQRNIGTSAFKETLESIGGQILELFRTLEQDYEKKVEREEETALMERITEDWMQTLSKIESISKQICDDTQRMKQMFKNIKNFTNIPVETVSDNECAKEGNKIMQCDAIDASLIQSRNQENAIFVYTIWERMRSVTGDVEKRCHCICKLISGLEQKLGSLNESVEKLDEFVRRVNSDILTKSTVSTNDNDVDADIIDSILQRNSRDAGDGHQQDIASKLTYGPLVQNIQNAINVNEMKMMEIMLRKFRENRNCQDRKNFTQPNTNNAFITADESRPMLTNGGHVSQDLRESEDNKIENKN